MVLFNYSTKELTAKVVYYGPGLCGKTTNLQWIHEKLPIRNKGKMLSLATEADRTLFFDFLPIELGSIRGMKTRIQLYTVPGQVFYNATRRMVLKGADCVVFVADSQEAMIDADLDSLANLKENLEVNEINPDEIPMVLQYNKRDLPNALPVEILNERLNPRNLPYFEAVAMKGIGVEETLKGATTLVFKSLAGKYGGEAGGPPTMKTGPQPTPAAAPAAAPPRAAAPAPTPAPAPAARPAAVAPAAPVRQAAPAPAARTVEDPLFDLTPAPPVRPSDLQSTDDLLNSLDLGQPGTGAPEIGLGGPSDDVEETIEELEVLPEDAPEPLPPPSGRPGRTTLVKDEDESEEMRRRIGRPHATDVALDELSVDDDEISLDAPPAAKQHSFTGLDEGHKAARAPAAPPAARADARPPIVAAPVSVPVEITVARGEHEVTIPIEVTVGRPGTPTHVRLHIALKVKISG
jgi:signal recognition particle receptor subunit beta